MGVIDRLRGVKWRFVLIGLIAGWVTYLMTSLLTSGPAPTSIDPETDVALTMLELIALILAALAIAFQAAMQVSTSGAFPVFEDFIKFRRYVIGVVAVTSFSLFLGTYLILQYLSLPAILSLSLGFITFSIFGFAIIPILISVPYFNDDYRDFEQIVEFFPIYQTFMKFYDLPEEEKRGVIDTLGMEMGKFEGSLIKQREESQAQDHGE